MQSNYYGIIPAPVRYDKTISANAKLMYSEIAALTNKTGECWASNEFFCSLPYDWSDRTVSRLIASLKNAGHINVTLVYKNNFSLEVKRIITLTQPYTAKNGDINKIDNTAKNGDVDKIENAAKNGNQVIHNKQNVDNYPAKNGDTVPPILSTPHAKNGEDNNITINNIKSNNKLVKLSRAREREIKAQQKKEFKNLILSNAMDHFSYFFSHYTTDSIYYQRAEEIIKLMVNGFVNLKQKKQMNFNSIGTISASKALNLLNKLEDDDIFSIINSLNTLERKGEKLHDKESYILSALLQRAMQSKNRSTNYLLKGFA